MRSSFSLYVITKTLRQEKTSTHHDGNATSNHQTSSHNEKTTPHNNVAVVHYDKTSRPKKIRIHKKGMTFHILPEYAGIHVLLCIE